MAMERFGRITRALRPRVLGLGGLAVGVGVGAGLGAVGFRSLVSGVTWIATGRPTFGQQGRVGSLHLPWLGSGFLLVAPVVGGVLYGPLIARFAPEARGHGVPEVMIAVAEDGGRIRPRVTIVKALASALCIGSGGSVGREGPIVQIGSALASSIGQRVALSEARLRILVAAGGAGAISATFNAPITGVFFGFEIILRELTGEALYAIITSVVAANLVGRAFLGSGPFFAGIPHSLAVTHNAEYVFVLVLGLVSGVIGVGFKATLYRIEDLSDALWGRRPEWARPVIGGVVLGAVLLALPEMYGVGYPVMNEVISGHVVLWLIILLLVAKPLAASLTIGIGGSGGVFAPSLFTGAMTGAAFGIVVRHCFGTLAGPLALYAVVAMGALFGAGTQAPITAIASVVEMSGDFGLTVPVMLAVVVAVAVSRRLTYGTIYTTKLLRRGIDIDRPRPANLLQILTAHDVMQPLRAHPFSTLGSDSPSATSGAESGGALGSLVERHPPQGVVEDEPLDQTLRQLALYGPNGLPVVDADRTAVVGWVTREDVVDEIAERLELAERDARLGRGAAEWAEDEEGSTTHDRSGLDDVALVEIEVTGESVARGRAPDDLPLPEGWMLAAVRARATRRTVVPSRAEGLAPGDRLILLAPAPPVGPLSPPPPGDDVTDDEGTRSPDGWESEPGGTDLPGSTDAPEAETGQTKEW